MVPVESLYVTSYHSLHGSAELL